MCSRLIFKRLLLKLTTESTFMFQSNFYKQVDGCTMGGPLSVTLANIALTKLEIQKVKPTNPVFYKRYVDDVINRRKTDEPDTLFTIINSYHPNINFTIEKQPDKFLDTSLKVVEGKVITSVYRKPNKLPTHWSSKIPKRYKRNCINADLNRSYRISMDFESEKHKIRDKFIYAGYPSRFTESVITQFEFKINQPTDDNELLIPENFFAERKKFMLIELPFCAKNEDMSKRFLEKLHIFTKHNFEIAIKWVTKKVRQLFKLKDKNPHPSCKIYEGICTCSKTYIGETKRNVETRWNEHNNPNKNSEPAKHIRHNPDHHFTWKVILNAPLNKQLRKYLEASVIARKRPEINDQIESYKLVLFRNGIT